MDLLNTVVNEVNNVLWSYVLIAVLVGCGLWFTLSTKFVQLRMLPEMVRLLTDGIGEKTKGKSISSFQAFCVSTASRVGVGNIAGVAIAIVTGGPGAVFWMWVRAFLVFIVFPSWACTPKDWPKFTSCRVATTPSTAARLTISRMHSSSLA